MWHCVTELDYQKLMQNSPQRHLDSRRFTAVRDLLLLLISAAYPDAGSQYIHFQYNMYINEVESLIYSSVTTAYHCYTKCRDETSFVCQGFHLSDYHNVCVVRAGNYDYPGAESGTAVYDSSYAIARTGTNIVNNGRKWFALNYHN